MKSILAISALLLSYASCVKAAGGFTCQTPQKQPGSMAKLAYCVYDPVDSAPSSGWPTIISLPGSGARGPPSNAKTLAGYDAVGKLVAQYLSGQKDASHTMAATKFLTIVPIAPDGSRHFDPDNVLAILDEVKSNYKVDSTRVYVTGFSMGSRGCWRFGTAHPDVVAAMACSAGGAEKAGDGTLTQEPAPPVFPLLKNIISIPSRQFAGSSDTTAGTESPKATENQLQSLGAKNANLDIMNTDHMGLSTKPWTDTDLLSWFLQQSQSGSSSAPAASNSTSSSPSKSKPSPVAKKPGMVKITRPAQSNNTTVDDEDEDCDETQTADDDEEDCEDDGETSTVEATNDEDCEEDSTDGGADEEDCEEDDSTASNATSINTRRSVPVVPAGHKRSIYISHKRRAVRFGKAMH